MTANYGRERVAGFSLIEMVGVLAIMSILAALLLPKIFEAVRQAQLAATAAAVSSVKGATMTYYAKFGRFGDVSGNILTATNDPSVLDWGTQVLLMGAYTEKPFRTPISDTALVRLRATVTGVTVPTPSNTAYNLDGLDPNLNDSSDGRWVVEVYLTGLSVLDAVELNDRIDGIDSTLPADMLANQDTQGRVKYDANAPSVNVSIYISHR